jgi:hypothetical protein
VTIWHQKAPEKSGSPLHMVGALSPNYLALQSFEQAAEKPAPETYTGTRATISAPFLTAVRH